MEIKKQDFPRINEEIKAIKRDFDYNKSYLKTPSEKEELRKLKNKLNKLQEKNRIAHSI